MANPSIFITQPIKTDTRNEAGGVAYQRSPVEALTQFAMTGTFNDTFYVSAQTQLQAAKELVDQVPAEYLAKLAVYARQQGYMKDMPAFLLAALSSRDLSLTKQIFPLIVTNGKMLRNYVQMIRSGTTGRKSFGTALRRLIADWLLNSGTYRLLSTSVGNNPSLNDIIRMVHPKPMNAEQGALFAWFMKNLNAEQYDLLPPVVRALEAFRKDAAEEMPDVPFELLTSTDLTPRHWMEIAKRAPWQMTRMNLNTFARNDVFANPEITDVIVRRLTDSEQIKKSNVFPYQCLTAWKFATEERIPQKIRDALETILERSTENTPRLKGVTVILIDVSGSMNTPVTGVRLGASSKIMCSTVAALLGCSLAKVNPGTDVILFNHEVLSYRPREDNKERLVEKIAEIERRCGGGTNCGAAMQFVSQNYAPDQIIMISDNESWVDTRAYMKGSTDTVRYWHQIKARRPDVKLVCIDLTPNTTVQAPSRASNILNIGGFSDAVFKVLDAFCKEEWNPDFWINKVNSINLAGGVDNPN